MQFPMPSQVQAAPEQLLQLAPSSLTMVHWRVSGLHSVQSEQAPAVSQACTEAISSWVGMLLHGKAACWHM